MWLDEDMRLLIRALWALLMAPHQVKAVEEYEAALREERQGRAAVEAQLREAQAVIDAAAKTRREMEGFCRQFRKDVEAVASER